VSAIKSFFEEYQQLLRRAKEQEKPLYLIDVLEQLNFLDSNILNGFNTQALYNSLRMNLNSHRINLLVEAPTSHGEFVPPDLQMNLFKIMCAVQNLCPNQRGSFRLDDKTLQTLL
jgi:hypothetical protein